MKPSSSGIASTLSGKLPSKEETIAFLNARAAWWLVPRVEKKLLTYLVALIFALTAW